MKAKSMSAYADRVSIRILAAILVASCSVQAQAEDCKAKVREQFSAFFSRYETDKQFAISRTTFPLRSLKREFGLDEKGRDVPSVIRSSISQAQFSASPALSTYAKENGLSSRIKPPAARSAIVEVFKPDTDWLISYHFQLKGSCWFLSEYQDQSL